MDTYTKKFVELIKHSHSDDAIAQIINRVYDDGFCDGLAEKEEKVLDK